MIRLFIVIQLCTGNFNLLIKSRQLIYTKRTLALVFPFARRKNEWKQKPDTRIWNRCEFRPFLTALHFNIYFICVTKRTNFTNSTPPLTHSRIRLIATGKFTCMTSHPIIHENLRIFRLITASFLQAFVLCNFEEAIEWFIFRLLRRIYAISYAIRINGYRITSVWWVT